MKPLRLSLQGFKSHEARTEIDFSTRTLFAIVGPTGAGKTTILDGISYALYGKTPKVQRSTKTLICSTKDSAEIELEFEAEGRVYTINRAIRRTGTPVHVLTDDAGEKTIGDTAVSAAVEDLLRLDFNAFRSSVLLAQNQFDEFFNATPDTRMRILKGVFRFDQLDQMRDAAKTHKGELERDAATIQGGLSEVSQDAAEQVAEANESLSVVDERIRSLKTVGPAEQKLVEKREKAHEELAALTTQVEELQELAHELPQPKVLQRLVAADEQITGPLEKTKKQVIELKADRKKAKASLDSLETKLGKEALLVGLQEKASRWTDMTDELTEARTAVKESATARSAAEKANAAALAKEKTTAAALAKIEDDRRALHTAHAAHGLRVGLAPGDPCPVCEQEIKKVPKGKAPAAFETIDARVAEAKAAVEAATSSARKAGHDLATAIQRAESAEKTIGKLEERVAKLEAELAGSLGKTKDYAAEVAGRIERLADAREALERLDTDLEEANDELEGHQQKAADLKEIHDSIFDGIAHVASTMKQKRPDRKATLDELTSLATALADGIEARMAEANEKLEGLGNAKEKVDAEITELHEKAGLEPGQTVESALAAMQEQRGALNTKIERLTKDIERSKELARELKKVKAEIEIYDTLYTDLANTKFIDYLLEDKRRLLSELASVQLEDMTGRYRFDPEGTFRIIDGFNADTERGVESLSGGETFLASLALALGLAESVTRHGGRLQCFFLDEGFGSLDPDSLQKALDGIERIATQDRLIGLVSHTQGVAERVVDRIELDRDDNGMTLVKETATPVLRVVG